MQSSDILNYYHRRKEQDGVSNSRVRIELSIIRAMYNFARRRETVNTYPFIKFWGSEIWQSGKRMESMDKLEIDRLLHVIDNDRFRDYVCILLSTG